jgi:hypothetical protein
MTVRSSAFRRLTGPAWMWLGAHGGLGLSAFAQARQAVLLPPHWCTRGDHPPEKRKVDSSILSLTTTTTTLSTISQPCYLRRQQEDRDSHGAVSAPR